MPSCGKSRSLTMPFVSRTLYNFSLGARRLSGYDGNLAAQNNVKISNTIKSSLRRLETRLLIQFSCASQRFLPPWSSLSSFQIIVNKNNYTRIWDHGGIAWYKSSLEECFVGFKIFMMGVYVVDVTNWIGKLMLKDKGSFKALNDATFLRFLFIPKTF